MRVPIIAMALPAASTVAAVMLDLGQHGVLSFNDPASLSPDTRNASGSWDSGYLSAITRHADRVYTTLDGIDVPVGSNNTIHNVDYDVYAAGWIAGVLREPGVTRQIAKRTGGGGNANVRFPDGVTGSAAWSPSTGTTKPIGLSARNALIAAAKLSIRIALGFANSGIWYNSNPGDHWDASGVAGDGVRNSAAFVLDVIADNVSGQGVEVSNYHVDAMFRYAVQLAMDLYSKADGHYQTLTIWVGEVQSGAVIRFIFAVNSNPSDGYVPDS